jgi:hypothetical protein
VRRFPKNLEFGPLMRMSLIDNELVWRVTPSSSVTSAKEECASSRLDLGTWDFSGPAVAGWNLELSLRVLKLFKKSSKNN